MCTGNPSIHELRPARRPSNSRALPTRGSATPAMCHLLPTRPAWKGCSAALTRDASQMFRTKASRLDVCKQEGVCY